ncbi:hypothetical protein BU24DRAFT_426476 [Aaosphaeria arxii CBS 175.79]|uniref:DUF3176 domain-containing protein n=1 Tax=Aaosphaeria arxii CBS 175.79 TaxID=1450172 RepID=A0A6A5XEB9_9PLEO|nr:uncharacterized protein BU24DRAFT_426476 [Aaosphaeria arxii CBS 175.79]KAF2011398.1 hypothetical protein BU24DRAFT_426476 [Aaosphaeria arxii CBS 175.79]
MAPIFDKPLPPAPTYESAEDTISTFTKNTTPPFFKGNRASTQSGQKRVRLVNLRHLYRKRAAHSYLTQPHVFEEPHQRNDFGLGLGLGIGDFPEVRTEEKSTEAAKARRNAAQWIEERIWRYTSTGSIVRRWTLEILSWSISAACMCAIIVILILLENKPVPKWPLAQTFNMLSRVASAALILPVSEALGQLKWNWFKEKSKEVWDFEIFDNASRGPLGSALLLVRTKGKTLASLGAAVTLLALALDPFFQQVIDFPQHWKIVKTGSIPRVIWYEPGPLKAYIDDFDAAMYDSRLQPVVTLFAFGNGTQPVPFGNGTRPDIPLTCPTSKCTWPPYETLGFCSACEELTQMLTYACKTIPDDWSMGHVSDDHGPTSNGTVCGYFLNATSSAPVFMSGYAIELNSSTKGEALLVRTLSLTKYPAKQSLYGGSILYKDLRNPVVDFLTVSARNDVESVYRNEIPVMHECILHLCVKTIESSYDEGTYKEKVTKTYVNATAGAWPWESTTSNSTSGVWFDVSYRENVIISAPHSINGSHGSLVQFGMSNVTFDQVVSTFGAFSGSTLTVQSSSALSRIREGFWGLERYSRDAYDYQWMAPHNITQHLSRMATAMTDSIRSATNTNITIGPAFDLESYVSVTWAWLTLPLLILVLSAIFLIGTVLKTSKDKDEIGVWKTSAMATLMYGGLPADVHEKLKQNSNSIGTPRTKAKRFKASLLPKQGWRFSGDHSSPGLADRARPSEWV